MIRTRRLVRTLHELGVREAFTFEFFGDPPELDSFVPCARDDATHDTIMSQFQALAMLAGRLRRTGAGSAPV